MKYTDYSLNVSDSDIMMDMREQNLRIIKMVYIGVTTNHGRKRVFHIKK
jgi:hypothetical protein